LLKIEVWCLPLNESPAKPRSKGKTEHENRYDDGKYGRNDPETRERRSCPYDLVNQAAESGYEEQQEQQPTVR
jgi:hypothetical protein